MHAMQPYEYLPFCKMHNAAHWTFHLNLSGIFSLSLSLYSAFVWFFLLLLLENRASYQNENANSTIIEINIEHFELNLAKLFHLFLRIANVYPQLLILYTFVVFVCKFNIINFPQRDNITRNFLFKICLSWILNYFFFI